MLKLFRFVPSIARQTAFLFLVDAITNATDYAFHVFLGRTLRSGDFAVVQTVNAAVLVLVTAFAVMQPVMARYVAQAETDPPTPGGLSRDHGRVVFQHYFRYSTWVGLALTGAALLFGRSIAELLNVPPMAIRLSAAMLLLALLRPVVAGMLQGQKRFVAFGLTRCAYAIGRLAVGVILVGLGGGALGAIAALPIGATLALLLGLGFAGAAVWRAGPPLPSGLLKHGTRLSLGALVAYGAYMSLHTMDLIWVNRSFPGEVAGSYATAVLLRRVLALLPGAIVVIMYPRVAAQVSQRQLPDTTITWSSIVVIGTTAGLTALYFAFGPSIVRTAFGERYVAAGPLLGWMGIAMLGYGLAVIWLNVYLASRPSPFIALLAVTALLQATALGLRHETVLQTTAVFGLAGWAVALGGLAIYLVWLRPQLVTFASGDR